MKKAIIILGTGSNQVMMYKTLHETDFTMIGIDRNPDAPGFGFCEERIVASTHEADTIIEKLRLLQPRYSFDGVITRSSGPPLFVQTKIAECFSLISAPLAAIEICSRKSTTVEFSATNEIAAPKRYTLDKLKSVPDLFPVVKKPDVTLLGKKDIRTANSFVDLVDLSEDYEIEQYIEGKDVTCFSCVYDGMSYPIVFIEEYVGVGLDGDYVGLGMGLRDVSYEAIGQATQKITTALCLKRGIISPNFRLNASIPYLLEIHLDIGGDYIFDYLLPYAGYHNPFMHLISPFLQSCSPLPALPEKIRSSLMLFIFISDEMDDSRCVELERRVGKVILVDDNNKIRKGLVLLPIDGDVFARIQAFNRILDRKDGMEIQQFDK